MSLRVLHCIHSLNSHDGGPARSVPSLARAEAHAGADVRVWSDQKATIDVSSWEGVKFVSGSLEDQLSDDWEPEVVHDHGVWLRSNHTVATLAQAVGIPRVVTPRGMLEPWCLNHHRFRKKLAWKLYQHRNLHNAAGLHATSQSEADQFRRLGFRQPIFVLPNGVTFPSQFTKQKDHATIRREIVFLSRIHPKKGLVNLVNAWALSRREGWILRIIGPDENGHLGELQRLVAALDLSESIRFEPEVRNDETWAVLRNAATVVLPSFSENFGIVIAESLAAGTPVITTTGTPWEEVTSKKCGWYVQPTVVGLSTALRTTMHTQPCNLLEMGRRGQTWMMQEFRWEEIGANMLKGYDWLLREANYPNWIQQRTKARRTAA